MGILACFIDPAAADAYLQGLSERNAALDAQISALMDEVLLDQAAALFE
ncbi:hypothetical protein QCE62_05560 [Caballeronia sp. LZ033]|nr:hypothetical protein [Caballeronia sp. LZ033]MDR5813056.1 hypothetical protein [Caballeronia sp. LZ033]